MADSKLFIGPLPYPFKLRPYQHQLDAWNRWKDEEAMGLLFDTGAGKSKSLIDQVAHNFDQKRLNALVVLCPKGNYRDWPDSHIPTHMPDHVCYRVATWAATATKAQLAAIEALFEPGFTGLRILVMNIEAIGTDRAWKLLERFLKATKAMCAIDESTVIKNPKSLRTKALMKLRKYMPFRRILTGEMTPNGPMDAYSQFAFLDTAFLGHESFYSFRAQFAVLAPGYSATGKKFDKIVGFRQEDLLRKLISKHAFIVKKQDCLDLPPKTYLTRNVEMGPLQANAYEEMRSLCMVLLANEEMVTAQLVITQLLRMHQILCGFMVLDGEKGEVRDFDEPNPRLEAVMQDLRETSGKAIVWCTYKHNVEQIRSAIAKEFGPETVVTYYGPNTIEERQAAVSHFDLSQPRYNPNSPVRFFVSNKTGARGLTLTAANTALYYSNDYNRDTRVQNEARPDRIGQHWPVTYIDYVVRNTEDEKITKALQRKEDLAALITPSNWRHFFQC